MIRLDSCHIEVSAECLTHCNLDDFEHSPKYKNKQIFQDIYELKAPISGIKYLKFDNINKSFKMDFSAKILLDDYFQGISINTIEQAIGMINQLGIVELDEKKVIESGVFHHVDSTNNVDMATYDLQNQWNDISSSLTLAKSNNRFTAHSYNRLKNKGIEFRGNHTTEKNRLIFYDKPTELSLSRNRHFLHSCKNGLALLKSANNILRVECNNTSHKSIRDRFKTKSTNVQQVLQSTAAPNIYMLDKITNPQETNQMILLLNDYIPNVHKYKDIKEKEGEKSLIRMCNYDETQYKEFVLLFESKDNWEHILYGRGGKVGIRQMIQELKIAELTTNIHTNEIIDHIRQSIIDDYSIVI